MINEAISAEIGRMEQAIEWAKPFVEKAPAGHLLVDGKNGAARCYWRADPRDKKGEYLGKDKESLKLALAQKDYALSLVKAATKEKSRLEKLLAAHEKGAQAAAGEPRGDVLARVFDALPEARKQLVAPFALNDEDYARQWLAAEYEGNGHSFGAGAYFTRKGVQVRSKSEIIIADALDAADVPFRYEQALFIGGFSPVYPDFTVLNKRTRAEYVWEHFGAMDDADYCQAALQKLNQYALAGYLPGDRLIVTQESADVPLDTRLVSALIERFLK